MIAAMTTGMAVSYGLIGVLILAVMVCVINDIEPKP